MISFLLAMVSYGRTPAALTAFLEAGGFPFEVLDVVSQNFDHGDYVLVGSGELGVIHHQLLKDELFINRGGGEVIEYPSRAFMPLSSTP